MIIIETLNNNDKKNTPINASNKDERLRLFFDGCIKSNIFFFLKDINLNLMVEHFFWLNDV